MKIREETVPCALCGQAVVIEFGPAAQDAVRTIEFDCPICGRLTTAALSHASIVFAARRPGAPSVLKSRFDPE